MKISEMIITENIKKDTKTLRALYNTHLSKLPLISETISNVKTEGEYLFCLENYYRSTIKNYFIVGCFYTDAYDCVKYTNMLQYENSKYFLATKTPKKYGIRTSVLDGDDVRQGIITSEEYENYLSFLKSAETFKKRKMYIEKVSKKGDGIEYYNKDNKLTGLKINEPKNIKVYDPTYRYGSTRYFSHYYLANPKFPIILKCKFNSNIRELIL